MRVLAGTNITSISADTFNPIHPVSALLDPHPKRKWKADDGDWQGTVTFSVNGIDCLVLFGTNARSAKLTISDPNEVNWEAGVAWEADVQWAYVEISNPRVLAIQSGSSYAIWIDLAKIESTVTVDMLLICASSETLEAGVLRAGIAEDFSCPSWGMREKLIDYSIRHELSNGSVYYRKRDIVRQFELPIDMNRDAEFYRLVSDIIRENGSVPVAWRLTPLGDDWVVLGRPEMPEAEHDRPHRSRIDCIITEVI